MNNDPISVLNREHEIIKKAVAILKSVGASALSPDEMKRQYLTLIGFFRNYADGYHHQKEEEALFPALEEKSEILSEGILKEMFDQHESMRGMIRESEALLNKNDIIAARKCLEEYAEALLDHIAVEDDELFITASDLLSEPEQERMFFSFMDADRERGDDKKLEWENALSALKGGISQ